MPPEKGRDSHRERRKKMTRAFCGGSKRGLAGGGISSAHMNISAGLGSNFPALNDNQSGQN